MVFLGKTSSPKIVVLGGLNINLIAVGERMSELGETLRGENFYSAPGGKGANQAVGCSRLGAEVTMVGRVGDDILWREGRTILTSLLIWFSAMVGYLL